jgi:EAL and modified HD-GYP domain-containing signal transduction protein
MALTAMTRARMCELVVANAPQPSDHGSAFIVGLLSLLDALLEIPMDKILDRIELSDEIRGALVARGGPLAQPLRLVEEYERANWSAARELARQANVASDALPEMYVTALCWARERMDD